MRITRLLACIAVLLALLYARAAFGQGAAPCMVTQLRVDVIVSPPGLKGAGDVLAAQAHFGNGTASPRATLSQTSPWLPYISHQITILLIPPKPLSEIQKIDLIHQPSEPGGSLVIDQVVVQATGDSASEPIFNRAPLASGGPFSFSGRDQVTTFTPAAPSGCTANSRLSLAPQRMLLAPQTNSPAGSGTLLPKGGAETSQSTQNGDRLTMNGGTATGTAASRPPVAIQENPNVFVAQSCAKDSTMRILGFKDVSSGEIYWAQQDYLILPSPEAAAFSTPRRNFTLLGCGFGTVAGTVQGIGDRGAGDVALFYFERRDWTNNSMEVTVPDHWNANLKGFASLICVYRRDGQKACALL